MDFLVIIRQPMCQGIDTLVGGTDQANYNQLKPHAKLNTMANYKKKWGKIISLGQLVSSYFTFLSEAKILYPIFSINCGRAKKLKSKPHHQQYQQSSAPQLLRFGSQR